MRTHNIQLAHRWIDAFNSYSLEKLLELYSEDAVHHSPKLQLRQPETGGKIKVGKRCEAGGLMLLNGCRHFGTSWST